MKADLIESFLDKKLITAPSTRRNYRMNIQNYFKILHKDMNTYFNSHTPEEYDDDLRKAYNIQQDNGRPDLSLRTWFNSIKQFMITNDKRLKDLEFWDTLKARTRGAEPDNDEAILNQKDIRQILSHGNACSRALFLMLASSGRRISEILALTPDDINTDTIPTTINIRKGLDRKTTKTKQKTLCYISNEATQAYHDWMQERDEYLRISATRSSIKKNMKDPRIFPMSYHNALIMWKTLLMKANLVEIERYRNKWNGRMSRRIKKHHKGERVMQHPHCLRKFFITYLGDYMFADFLAGHATVMTRTYNQKKPEDKAELYLKYMPNVTIFETPVDLSGINEDLKAKDEQIKDLQRQLNEVNKLLGLKNHLEKIIEEKVNGKK